MSVWEGVPRAAICTRAHRMVHVTLAAFAGGIVVIAWLLAVVTS